MGYFLSGRVESGSELLEIFVVAVVVVVGPSVPPPTSALRAQKEHSVSPVQNWWFGRLMDGHTTSGGADWKIEFRTDTLYDDYFDFSEKIGLKRRVTNVSFGKGLKIHNPDFERVRITNGKHRYWAYRIPDLESCQRHFDLKTGSEYDWPTDD